MIKENFFGDFLSLKLITLKKIIRNLNLLCEYYEYYKIIIPHRITQLILYFIIEDRNYITVNDLNFFSSSITSINTLYINQIEFKDVKEYKFLNGHQIENLCLKSIINIDNIVINLDVNYLKNLTVISCFKNSIIFKEFLRKLINLNKLSIKIMNKNEYVNNDFFDYLIKSNCNLEQLKFHLCNFETNCGKNFGKFLSKQTKLLKFKISSINLNDNEFGMELFKNIDSKCCSLREITFIDCHINENMSKYFGQFIGNQKHLLKLNLSNTNLKFDKGKNLFENLPSSSCMNLKELHFSSCKFSSDMTYYLGKFIGHQTQLSFLDLSKTDLRDYIGLNLFKNINSNCCNIMHLNFNECKFCENMTKELGEFISFQTRLSTLNLYRVNLKENIGKYLFDNIPSSCCNVEQLFLFGSRFSPEMTVSLGKYVGYQKNLSLLCLSLTELDRTIGKNLFKGISCNNITHLDLWHCKFSSDMSKELAEFIGCQNQLKILNLTGTNLGDDVGKLLFENISNSCKSIQNFRLKCCVLSSGMTASLGLFIGRQTRLQFLDLSSTNLVDEIGGKLFGNISLACCNIEEIKLYHCQFSCSMSERLGRFIQNQVNLNVLSLPGTDLRGEIGEKFFLGMTNSCTSIRKLKFRYCKISNSMSDSLGQFIGFQKNLQNLDLSGINFESNIGRSVFGSISSSCCRIISLYLSFCKFSECAIENLGRFLTYQKRLETLSFSGTNLKGKIGLIIFKKLSSCRGNLKQININGCSLTDESMYYLDTLKDICVGISQRR